MSEQALFRLRVHYVKRGRLRYLGHLEVLHTIERIIRRAGLPYAVTQGFSPHMRAGFCAALPVGTASTCEWYDVFLTELVPAGEVLERLAAASPADLAPVDAGYVDVRAPALTAFITCARYEVRLWVDGSATAGDLRTGLDELRRRALIPYLRGTKGKTLDLGRTLADYALEEFPDDPRCFLLTLDTRMDNDGALRPEVLIGALDNQLAGTPDAPVHSTGIQDLARISRYEVTRVDQCAVGGDGTAVAPLEPVRSRSAGVREAPAAAICGDSANIR